MNANRLEFLKDLAKGINSVFGDRCEVVIHDFSDLKKSMVYISGDVTSRPLGSPIPDMLYRLLKEFGDEAPHKFGYKTTTEDGKIIKCATTMIRDDEGKLEGCFCINFNVTDFAFLATAFTGTGPITVLLSTSPNATVTGTGRTSSLLVAAAWW